MTRFALTFIFLFLLFPQLSFSDPLQKIAKEISKSSSQLKNKQIAVLPFPNHDGRESVDSTIISERLITKIAAMKKMKVIERSLLEKVFSELQLQYSGAINQDSAKELGKILGCEAILTGTLIDLGKNQIEVNARLIQTETGLVLSAASEVETRAWEVQPAPEIISSSSSSPDSEKNKMAAFFHSRDQKGYQHTTGRKAPEGYFSEIPQKSSNAFVLSNRDQRAPSLHFSPDEKMGHDLPKDLFVDDQSPQDSSDLEFIQKEWGSSWDVQNISNLIEKISRIKNDYLEQGKDQSAALSQIYLAEAYYRQGQYAQAIQEAKPVTSLNHFPKLMGRANLIIARSYECLKDYKEARHLYRKIVQNHPFDPKLIQAAGQRLSSDYHR